MTENLHIKLIEKLVNKKFEYWKEQFVKELLEEIEYNIRFGRDLDYHRLVNFIKQKVEEK